MMVYVPLSSLAVRLLLHFVHLNGLSPVWVASCALGRVNWQKKFLGGPNSTYGSKKCPQKVWDPWPKFGPLSFWVQFSTYSTAGPGQIT